MYTKRLAKECYEHLTKGHRIQILKTLSSSCNDPCQLCGMDINCGFYIFDFADAQANKRQHVHHDCLSRFSKVYNASSRPTGWYHVSKAHLLPLGDVCGVIARILNGLIRPSDVYLFMFQ